jgi:hypothetical protein
MLQIRSRREQAFRATVAAAGENRRCAGSTPAPSDGSQNALFGSECGRSARVLYAWYFSDRIWFFRCRGCAGITYQSTIGHRWDRSARQVEKLRARLQWGANGTVPIKPRGMHKRTYQRILGMLAYHQAIRKQGASYARKYRPDQHRAHLWRQCRNRFVGLGGWPVRLSGDDCIRG